MNVTLLGPLELQLGGAPVAIGASGPRSLLARLLLDPNRPVAVDRLVDDLWGEDPPRTAGKIIQIHVSKLRKVLPAGILVTRGHGYAIRIDREALDIVRFERLRERGASELARGSVPDAADRLREALALWRGPALAEFDQPFATVESRRLEEIRLACLEDRIEADLALGRHPLLIGELAALVARDPLRERLRGQHMLALYRSGRQVEALAAYRDLRDLLAAELALVPSPALRELEGRILRQDPALDHVTRRRQPSPDSPSRSLLRRPARPRRDRCPPRLRAR